MQTDSLPPPWVTQASCAGLAGPWDADASEADREHARAVCGRCAVATECLALGLAERLSGIWGGADLIGGKPGAEVRAKIRAAAVAQQERIQARRASAA